MILNSSSAKIGKVPKKPIRVLICLVTLGSFLFNTVFYDMARAVGAPPTEIADDGPNSPTDPNLTRNINVANFTLPEYLGHVKGLYEAPKSDKVVIHIQDAHTNYACQQQIAEIIGHVNKKYGMVAVNLEGGAKGYDLSPFTGISDKMIKNKVADYFMKEGLVNGAEYFAINNPGKADLWGVEDVKLYLDSLAVYRNSLRHKEEIDKSLQSLSQIISILKTRIYSKELLDFDMKYGAYKANNIEFKEYLSYLLSTAKAKGIDTKKLTNVYLLDQAFAKEMKIDFRKANRERDDLINDLQKRLSKNAIEELVTKTMEFKQERISQKSFYAYLMGKTKKAGIDMSAFPDLQKYVAYISIYGAMDETKVMDEKEKLEDAIKGMLCQNEKEKELSLLSKNLAILKNIFDISLAKDDYKYYLANRDSFTIARYTAFIGKEALLNKVTEALDEDASNLDRYCEDISKFYEYSIKRDEAFLRHMKYVTTGSNNRAAILVTGGFHNENLAELFRKEGISYVSIIPNFKNYEGYKCPYFKILSGKKSDLILSLDEALGVMQVASLYNALGVEVDPRAAEIARVLPRVIAYAMQKGTSLAILTTGGDYLVLDKIGDAYQFSRKPAIGNIPVMNKDTPLNTRDTGEVLRMLGEIGQDMVIAEAPGAEQQQPVSPGSIKKGLDLISLLNTTPLDLTALVSAMKQEMTAPGTVQKILADIEKLKESNEINSYQAGILEMALRSAAMVRALSDVEKTEHINIVAQVAEIGESNRARKPIQDLKNKLGSYPYNLYAQSILEEGIDSEDGLKALIDRVITSVKEPSNKNPRALLLLPENLHKYFEYAKGYLKENGIDIDKPDALVKIQKIEQGTDPDFLTQFGLGFEILEYVRKGEGVEPSQGLLNLIAAMVDGAADPRAVLGELFKNVLRIRKIDWRKIDEQRKAWEAVVTAL